MIAPEPGNQICNGGPYVFLLCEVCWSLWDILEGSVELICLGLEGGISFVADSMPLFPWWLVP